MMQAVLRQRCSSVCYVSNAWAGGWKGASPSVATLRCLLFIVTVILILVIVIFVLLAEGHCVVLSSTSDFGAGGGGAN